jgi:hypothetical protein
VWLCYHTGKAASAAAAKLLRHWIHIPEEMSKHFETLDPWPMILLVDCDNLKFRGEAGRDMILMNANSSAFYPPECALYTALHELTHRYIDTRPDEFQPYHEDVIRLYRWKRPDRTEEIECEALVDRLLRAWGFDWLIQAKKEYYLNGTEWCPGN